MVLPNANSNTNTNQSNEVINHAILNKEMQQDTLKKQIIKMHNIQLQHIEQINELKNIVHHKSEPVYRGTNTPVYNMGIQIHGAPTQQKNGKGKNMDFQNKFVFGNHRLEKNPNGIKHKKSHSMHTRPVHMVMGLSPTSDTSEDYDESSKETKEFSPRNPYV